MHTRRPRVRRGAPPRRRNSTRTRRGSTRTHGRATARRQPARRRPASTRRPVSSRRPHRRNARASRFAIGKSLKTAIGAGVAVTAVVAVVAFLAHGFPRVQPVVVTGGPAGPATQVGPAGPVAGQFVYTARTANDAPITLPAVVQAGLRQDGLAHQSIELTRIDYTGTVSTSDVDLTPRTGNSPQDPVLKVPGRALPAIDAKISGIEADVNAPSGTAGGRALYAGLTRTDFTGAPVTIISSGIDLADPDDFRSLQWKVPPGDVVADVRNSGDQPALHGPVTFVLIPVAGAASARAGPEELPQGGLDRPADGGGCDLRHLHRRHHHHLGRGHRGPEGAAGLAPRPADHPDPAGARAEGRDLHGAAELLRLQHSRPG